MQLKWMRITLVLVGMAALVNAVAYAETDVAASLYGAFAGTTTSNNVSQSPSNSAGGLLEVRHISKPWIGYEGTYSYNRANQVYKPLVSSTVCLPTGFCGGPTSYAVSANAHEVTGDWIASVKVTNFRPFALAGGGLLFNQPVSGQSNTTSATKPVFVYGAGVDWTLLPHIGLRFQYRGNLYKAPNLTKLYTSTNVFTHTAEPMLGAFFRF